MCVKNESSMLSEEKNRTAIIIDDDKAILRTFSLILQRKGYSTDTAKTGKEALDKISFNHYDVALIDMRLPDIQGTDLVAKLPEKSSSMVKIIITGLLPLDSGTQTSDREVDAYLLKPIKPDELISIIEKNLKRRCGLIGE
jgi:DNA-binding NtrC family response regulator